MKLVDDIVVVVAAEKEDEAMDTFSVVDSLKPAEQFPSINAAQSSSLLRSGDVADELKFIGKEVQSNGKNVVDDGAAKGDAIPSNGNAAEQEHAAAEVESNSANGLSHQSPPDNVCPSNESKTKPDSHSGNGAEQEQNHAAELELSHQSPPDNPSPSSPTNESKTASGSHSGNGAEQEQNHAAGLELSHQSPPDNLHLAPSTPSNESKTTPDCPVGIVETEDANGDDKNSLNSLLLTGEMLADSSFEQKPESGDADKSKPELLQVDAENEETSDEPSTAASVISVSSASLESVQQNKEGAPMNGGERDGKNSDVGKVKELNDQGESLEEAQSTVSLQVSATNLIDVEMKDSSCEIVEKEVTVASISEEETTTLEEEDEKKLEPVISLVAMSTDNNSDSDEEEEEHRKVPVDTSPKDPKKDGSVEAENKMEEEEVLNYASALEQLSTIATSAKTLDEDQHDPKDSLCKKRCLEENNTNSIESKRAKTTDDEEGSSQEAEATKKTLKKHLRCLTRNDVEELVASKVVEVMSCRSEVGELRKKCDQLEELNEKWRRKTQAWRKMFQDLNTVMKRYIVDVQNKKERVAPIKITRSVGLQVLADGKRKKNPQNVSNPRPHAKQHIFPPALQKQKQHPEAVVPPSPPPQSTAKVPSIHSPGGAIRLVNQSALVKQSGPGVTISPVGRNLPKPSPIPITNKASVNRSTTPQFTTTTTTTTQMENVVQPQPMVPNSAKKVIDVVDLSDDDEPTATTGRRMQQQQQQPLPVTYSYVNSGTTTTTSLLNSGSLTMQRNQIVVSPMVSKSQHQLQQQIQQQQVVINRNNQLIPVTSSPLTIQRSAVPPANGMRQIIVNPPGQPGSSNNQLQIPPRLIAPMTRAIHPAPPPDLHSHQQPSVLGAKKIPPSPTLKISCLKAGIVLSWDMKILPTEHAAIKSYQIFAYQESKAIASPSLWKKVGDVKALPLPMACTLTQFTKGNKYHFAVRAQDLHARVSLFSESQSISLN